MDQRIYPDDLAARFVDQAGKKYRPSNGTEGEYFTAAWCEQCKRDAAFQADPDTGEGCPIVASTFYLDLSDPDYPAEWQYGPDGQPKCTAFDPVLP